MRVQAKGDSRSNVTLYIIGSLLVAGAFGYGIFMFFGPVWAMIAGAVILGFGFMGAVDSGRRRETPPAE